MGPLTDSEALSCVSGDESAREDLYDWVVRNAGAGEIPDDASLISIRRWAFVNAVPAGEACMALGFASDAPQVRYQRQGTMMKEAERVLAEVVDWSEDSFDFSMLADEGLTDSALVWCAANAWALVDAADVLSIGVNDSPELDIEATVIDTVSGFSSSWSVRDVTSETDRTSIWVRYHVDRVARACSAAFEAR